MIEKIIEFSIRNRFVVILAALGVVVWGVHAVINTPVDAIPDLSENQVIVFTDWMGRSPKEIEDQITYPFSVNLQGLAGVKAVRSSSEFNFSMINMIFEDNIDFYFAAAGVRAADAGRHVPAAGRRALYGPRCHGPGPDSGTRSKAKARTWAGCGPFRIGTCGSDQVGPRRGPRGLRRRLPIEYQIDVDPNKLHAYNVTLGEFYAAVARANSSVGGKVIQKATRNTSSAAWAGSRAPATSSGSS